MPFAPREIEEKEFLVSLRGYNREEVRAFLRAAAADYRAALDRVDREESRGDLEAYTRAPSPVVPVTDEAAEQVALERQRAESEAAEIRTKAQRTGRRILEEAEHKAAEIREAVDRHTKEQLDQLAHRVEDLRTLEERMARRLYFIETALELARRDLRTDGVEPTRDERPDTDQLPVSARRYLSPSAPADD